MKLPKLTVWRAIFAAIMLSGLYATYLRIVDGLGGSTNLSDQFPWGIWIGFDVMCGVALAAGGFTLVAMVHIFNVEAYKPVLRPAILTAFLGYSLVVVGLLFDLGRPDRLWHPLVMWNPHSVMFEVAWCVTLYTTVLALEFSPIVFEKFRLEKARRIIHFISIPLVIVGVILSTLHQSSLGSLYLIVPLKLHPLWYSSLLPDFFFVSAIAVGVAMTIFESSRSARHLNHALKLPLVIRLGRILLVALAVYAVLRFQDLLNRDALKYVFQPSYESSLFLAEVSLAFILPIILMLFRRIRESAQGLYLVSILVVLGFVMNRLNVSITGMEGAAGMRYIPKWTEVAVTLSIVAAGVAAFAVAVRYLPIFSTEDSLAHEGAAART